jgi:carbon-monoxide dehydrogenase medium subunit
MFRPGTVEEAVALLRRLPDVKIISGGATLVAMINARLAEPKALVSLAGVGELRGIAETPGGGIRIGAMTRHREAAAETRFACTLAVVRQAASLIANATVRNMGTIGGAISHADPGLDYPPAIVAAEAQIEIASEYGRRRIPASEFFVDWYTTALQSGELVVAVHLPAASAGVGLYHKFARVSGDYATVSVALTMSERTGGVATRVAIGACGPVPILLEEANALLSGNPGEKELRRAGELLAAAADPVDDVRGSAEYRRMLIPRMLARAFAEARAGLGAIK